MLISNPRSFIFLHVPKSGGTSVVELLDRDVQWNDVALGGTAYGDGFLQFWTPRFHVGKHALPSEVEALVGRDVYSRYKKFIVVRNPVDRFVSAYRFIKTLVNQRVVWLLDSPELRLMGPLSSIDEFFKSDFFLSSQDYDPARASEIRRLVMPQSIYFERPPPLSERIQFFRLEDLKRSCAPLVDAGFASLGASLDVHNRSDRFEARISKKMYAELRCIYREDYDVFGYSPRH
jgi:hypothetical protein